MKKIRIIGISAFFHDSAVSLIENGEIIYASQEERFSRIKHDSGFPNKALKNLLKTSNLKYLLKIILTNELVVVFPVPCPPAKPTK